MKRFVLAFAACVFANGAFAQQMRVVGSDETATFLALGLNKSIVIDFKNDIKEVLIGAPGVVNAVMKSKQRVYLYGSSEGTTSIYFFGTEGKSIGAINVHVTRYQREGIDLAEPAWIINNYHGSSNGVTWSTYSCTAASGCILGSNPQAGGGSSFSSFFFR